MKSQTENRDQLRAEADTTQHIDERPATVHASATRGLVECEPNSRRKAASFVYNSSVIPYVEQNRIKKLDAKNPTTPLRITFASFIAIQEL